MSHPAFLLTEPPVQTSSMVFASPHSGRFYSDAFLAGSVLDKRAIRSSEDAFIDMLFGCASDMGAPFSGRGLAARLSRPQSRGG